MWESVFFFFKQKTAYEIVSRDWSSDVCSSDLTLITRHSNLQIAAMAPPRKNPPNGSRKAANRVRMLNM